MSKIDLIDNGWVDLVFEGKNQAYGAYQLRKNTGARNLKAMITMFIGFAIIAAIVVAKVSFDNYMASRNAAIETDVELQNLAEKKEIKQEKKDEDPGMEKIEIERVKSSVAFTVPEIKKDDEVKEDQEMKSQEDLAETNTAIGAFTVEGNDETAEVKHVEEKIAEPEPVKEEETKVFDVVEQMPSFPGGPSALMQYLSSNIKYPVVAEENGVQGRVVCTFVVERDGSITDVRVIKSVDPSLDKEAVRVVKGMPRWIPGKQNGSAVRVKYTVPVTFRLQ
ncbi:MAG: energy transducer TonB [Prevotella sp.]|nr:energy transducer TonB [Prevotella sp.]